MCDVNSHGCCCSSPALSGLPPRSLAVHTLRLPQLKQSPRLGALEAGQLCVVVDQCHATPAAFAFPTSSNAVRLQSAEVALDPRTGRRTTCTHAVY